MIYFGYFSLPNMDNSAMVVVSVLVMWYAYMHNQNFSCKKI